MRFVSYAQNFEDIMLWRALKHISNGFYIDVGANDPVIDSVTKAFYDRGWHGINIDPSPKAYERLKQQRYRDLNLNIAIGNCDTFLTFYDVEVSGWSTLDESVALQHQNNGIEVSKRNVECKTLNTLYIENNINTVHFLKVDVEGAEEFVFQGIDLSKFRPWIIVAEATLPNSQIENYDKWDQLILNHNYEYVYYDGLNRFYIAKEHEELKQSFNLPPNPFDDFVDFKILNLEMEIKNLYNHLELEELAMKAKIHAALTDAHQANLSARDAHIKLSEAYTQLNAAFVKLASVTQNINEANLRTLHFQEALFNMSSSISWRITAPLRYLKSILRKIKAQKNLKGLIKKILQKLGILEVKQPEHNPIIQAPIIEINPNSLRLSQPELKIKAEIEHATQLKKGQ
ncbi:MAG: hypothetical protein RL154_288 [Pseudomonadota bacterium]|jgi:FkbM family methyltransferase